MTHTDRQREAGPPGAPAPPAPPAPGGDPAAYETGGVRMALLVGALAAVMLLWGWSALVIILGFVLMIFLHELGHYLTAKWSGMKVTEFFIGFGPRLWSFRRGETEYGFKAIPAGAYVRIIGMNNLDEVDPADEARTYRRQSFPKRLLVVSAGSLMHMLQALVLLVILLGVVGVPGGSVADEGQRARDWEVGSVEADSAAGEAGLREGDRIVAFDGEPVETWGDVTAAIRDSDVGDEVVLTVERDGERRDVEAELGPRPASLGNPGAPFLGVGARTPIQTIGLGRAVVEAPGELLGFSADAVGAMFGF
ncbi:MAG TPA: site-2 protease family protein, partial [Acidimicrobiales bacterium]